MYEVINDFLKSKNPVIVAFGLLAIFCTLVVSAFAITSKVNAFADKYETKAEHQADIEAKETAFKKDVRLAILENNQILLEKIEELHHRGRN